MCYIFWVLSFSKLNITKVIIWHPNPLLPAHGQGKKCPIQNGCSYFSMTQIPTKVQLCLRNLYLKTQCAGIHSVLSPPHWFSSSLVPSEQHFYQTACLVFIWVSSLPQISLNFMTWNLHARHQACLVAWILTCLRVEFQALVFLKTTVGRTGIITRCSRASIT